MKIKYTYLLIIFLISLITIQSCKKVIDLDIAESNKKIVLNSIVQDGELITVNLTKSKSILDDNKLEYIDNANIILTEDGTVLNSHTYNGSGDYVFNSYAKIGSVYKIKVDVSGLNEITSETKMPKPNSFYVADTLTINYDGEDYLGITIKILNTEANSYYYLEATNEYGDYIYIDSYDLKAEKEIWGDFVVFNNVISGSGDINFNFYISKYIYDYGYSQIYGNVYFYLHRVSEAYYKYYISANKQNQTGNSPFVEPVQIYNNIENGFGIFGSESLSTDSIEIL